jgi:hypothetical protein
MILGLDWTFEFEPGATSHYANPEERRARAIELMNLAINPILAPWFKLDKVMNRTLRESFDMIYPQEVMKTPQEMEAEQRQMENEAMLGDLADAITTEQIGQGMGAANQQEANQYGAEALSPYGQF